MIAAAVRGDPLDRCLDGPYLACCSSTECVEALECGLLCRLSYGLYPSCSSSESLEGCLLHRLGLLDLCLDCRTPGIPIP